MRLTQTEVKAIKQAFRQSFEQRDIYLFGSRVDDNKKGGDIDLFIDPGADLDSLAEKRLAFLVDLKMAIGDQKNDVVINTHSNRDIEKSALASGIVL